MATQKEVKILRDGLIEHPAVRAWSRLGPERVEPERIEVLKRKEKGAVYRLTDVGPRRSTVVAKRCHRAKALVERAVYEEILRRIDVTSLEYYGFVEEEDGRFCWLFLEDAGNQQYSPLVDEHRILAARWLAAAHTAAESMSVTARLPDLGSSHYLSYLQSARRDLLGVLSTRSLGADDRAILKGIVSLCEWQGSNWSQVERFCNLMPCTLVHGDCLPKNVHVRTVPAGLAVVLFDWGGAGWGLPGTDLGLLGLPRHTRVPSGNRDLETYLERVQDQWPSLDVQTIERLANLGQLFWALKVISRGVDRFDYPWAKIEHTVKTYRIYGAVLADSIRAGGWSN